MPFLNSAPLKTPVKTLCLKLSMNLNFLYFGVICLISSYFGRQLTGDNSWVVIYAHACRFYCSVHSWSYKLMFTTHHRTCYSYIDVVDQIHIPPSHALKCNHWKNTKTTINITQERKTKTTNKIDYTLPIRCQESLQNSDHSRSLLTTRSIFLMVSFFNILCSYMFWFLNCQTV